MAAVEDVDYRTPRGLDRAMFLKLASRDWIRERRHCLLTGPAGVGKSWLACALGYKACRENVSVFYQRGRCRLQRKLFDGPSNLRARIRRFPARSLDYARIDRVAT